MLAGQLETGGRWTGFTGGRYPQGRQRRGQRAGGDAGRHDRGELRRNRGGAAPPHQSLDRYPAGFFGLPRRAAHFKTRLERAEPHARWARQPQSEEPQHVHNAESVLAPFRFRHSGKKFVVLSRSSSRCCYFFPRRNNTNVGSRSTPPSLLRLPQPAHQQGSFSPVPSPQRTDPAHTSIMTFLILAETSAGYALFKAKDKKLLKRDDLAAELKTPEGAAGLCVSFRSPCCVRA